MALTGQTRAALYAADLDDETVDLFLSLVGYRRAGVPLQYLEGEVPFGPVSIRVDGRGLIPRPETEYLWDLAAGTLGEAGPGTRIVDLCTGSGALALAMKARFPEARVMGTDLSAEALALARGNADRNDLKVEWFQGDLFEALPERIKGRIDLIVTNPPYVAEAEYEDLPAEIREYEPRMALVAGPRGDEILARIADEAYWWLAEGGWFFCEIGETQAERALELFSRWLFCEVRTDLAGRPRILVGRKGAQCC